MQPAIQSPLHACEDGFSKDSGRRCSPKDNLKKVTYFYGLFLAKCRRWGRIFVGEGLERGPPRSRQDDNNKVVVSKCLLVTVPFWFRGSPLRAVQVNASLEVWMKGMTGSCFCGRGHAVILRSEIWPWREPGRRPTRDRQIGRAHV